MPAMNASNLPLEDKVVLVTGASSGIGAATARALVARGARVVLGARREERLAELAAELGEDRVAVRAVDVSDESDVSALVDLSIERFGRLDAAFANAGIGVGGTLTSGDPSRWREILLTNVQGVALTIHHALRPMLEAGDGHIVLTSSTVGRRIGEADPVYSASKFAVTALGEALRREVAGTVRVTMIEPGATRSEFPLTHLDHVLQAQDIAEAVLFTLERPPHVAVNEILIRPHGQVF
jgi:NADP-dependent 3-hydroxy acid dehydrogenase YdfG